MTAAIRYGPENSPNNVLDARLSPDYDFNTPTPLRPRVLEFEDVIDDDIRALREAEAEDDRRANDPHWSLEAVQEEDDVFEEWDGTRTTQEQALREAHELRQAHHSSSDSGSIHSTTIPSVEEPDDDDVIFVKEVTKRERDIATAWSCVRAAPTNDIFHVIDICYEVLEERGVDLGF